MPMNIISYNVRGLRREVSHWSSQVVEARARYSASDELHETVFCFLDCHETREEPKYTTNPVIERLES